MSKLVLIIDDDPDQRRLLDRMLGADGWRVATAPDGEAGIAAARSQRPDVIVLDVMMPRMNGFQTCRQLRADPETRGIPVVMLTTKDQPADAFWASQVGVDVFLHKPVDVRQLADTLTTLVEKG